ncbi:MAG: circadian clock KaiB family protein [Anaerolineae bacterium]
MNKTQLKLFITGQTPRSAYAIANLNRICQEALLDQCDVVIIDVLENPELAEDEKVLATPTLIKTAPPPARRVIGDLSDIQKVMWGLGLGPRVSGDRSE